MSFTTDIKNEISNIEYSDSEIISELSAIINLNTVIDKNSFSMTFENISIARRIYKLIKNIYHIEINMIKSNYFNLRKKNIVSLVIKEKKDLILKDLSIINDNKKRLFIPESFIYDSLEEKQAYLRGVFLVCGSINDPKTSRYHAEFMIHKNITAKFINDLLNELNFNSKLIKREKNYMVYIKEAEKISDFIKMIHADNSLYYFEDIRIYRDLKNMNNRWNNCEQANIDKSYNSSLEQIKLIEKLKSIKDFDLLDNKIKEVCIYREKYPEVSLFELATIISSETGNNITKSGLNHRFRKIKQIVNKIN